MTAPAPSPELPPPVDKRSRKVYVLWGIALGLLVTAGLVCWLVVPFLRTRNVLAECHDGPLSRKNALAALGGPEKAAEALGHYLEATDRIRPGSGDPDYHYRELATGMLGKGVLGHAGFGEGRPRSIGTCWVWGRQAKKVGQAPRSRRCGACRPAISLSTDSNAALRVPRANRLPPGGEASVSGLVGMSGK